MVELQIINKILQDKSNAILLNNNIGEEHFLTYKDEIKFINNHLQKYGTIPDMETFLERFNDFDVIEVGESEKYLVEKIKEQYMYHKMVPFVHKLAELVTEDSTKAVEFLMSQTDNIRKLSAQYREGYDIIKNSRDRREEFKFRNEAKGLLGITTGIEELDKITHGWMKEDLIIILGRTNEGKTWVLLFFLVAAWMAGVPVLLYSGEMSETLVGFRFDTLYGKFANDALMSGKDNLGDGKTVADYYEYLNNISTTDVPFIVITPKHLGGKRLDIPKLHQLIEQYKPGIVGIDQISLMDDYRREKGDPKRVQYGNIAEDLFLTSEKYGIPIIAPVQANRESRKDKKSKDGAPEVEHISESDAIAHNATRVISIRNIDVTMKFAIKKNRYGQNNRELLMIWDINEGIVKPFLSVGTDENGAVEEVEQLEGEDLF